MSNDIRPDDLRDALVKAGLGRELEYPGGAELLDRWARGMTDFIEYYHRRFGDTVNPFAWWESNPVKARAYFEPDTLSLSPEMKTAVWRILLGSDIRTVEMRFTPEEAVSHLRLVLRSPHGEVEEYTSSQPNDLKLVRHLGTVSVGGRLEFQGYHAFRR